MLIERSARDPLIILDLANNHNGSVEHGKAIIDGLATACAGSGFDVVVKFQYRDLDTFIHPAFQQRLDMKYVKRFLSTRLTWDEFAELTDYAKSRGFLTSATPFDESSVRYVKEHHHDILKVASASFTDWPLWEAVAETDLPIVASTAGASVPEIDRVVAFLSHRHKDFALMHCVAAYPTVDADLQLNRIDVLRQRYAPVPVGYSTHENPGNLVAGGLALAKGAALLERHVGVPSDEAALNDYSSDPELVGEWLARMRQVAVMCGSDTASDVNRDELEALRGLGRGVYLKSALQVGAKIKSEDVFFAIPLQDGQLRANEWSKYLDVVALVNLEQDAPILQGDVAVADRNELVLNAVTEVTAVLESSGVTYPTNIDMELSHHYGIDSFAQYGLAMLTVVNREYCKKLLVVLAGQTHPEQYHERKEETFHLLHGTLDVWLDGEHARLTPGDVAVVQPGVRHKFSSDTGAVLEEISSTHFQSDSYYTDEAITKNRDRKSFVKYWGNVIAY